MGFSDGISVIIPVHNASRTVYMALKSTLHGLGNKDRVHLFIDGQSGTSKAAIQSIADERLRIVGESTEPLGVRTALNKLLETVETKHVARMDADDISFPWRFKVQRSIIEDQDIVFSTAVIFGKALKPSPIIPQLPLTLSGQNAVHALLFGNPFVHPTMFSRTETIFRLGGYTEDFGQDYGLWLRAALSDLSLFRTAIPCVGYRFHMGQVSSSKKWKMMADSDVALDNLKERLLEKVKQESKLSSLEEILTGLYSRVPIMRLEHNGLPDWLRKKKDANRFSN